MPAKLGPTTGRVAHGELYGSRIRLYRKPTLGIQVVRKAGVNRTSKKVISLNEKVAAAKPAKACKGLHYPEIKKCLSEQMKKAVGKLPV